MIVRIRPLREEDAQVSYKWRNDTEVFKYTGANYDHEITLEDESNWIRRVSKNENEYRCAIIANEEYVGNIYLTDIENGHATYHIFIGNKDFWGKGIAKEASRLIINYGFNVLNLETIELEVRKQNKRAFELYKSLGFQIREYNNDWIKMEINHQTNDNNSL